MGARADPLKLKKGGGAYILHLFALRDMSKFCEINKFEMYIWKEKFLLTKLMVETENPLQLLLCYLQHKFGSKDGF